MSNQKIKTIFIGTPEFASKCLVALIFSDNFKLLAVITQPDKKSGRGHALTPPPVKQSAVKNKIPVFQPEKIIDFADEIKAIKPDIIIVAAYSQILPEKILKIPKYGCLNVHGSLLPKYRGAACVQAAILNNEKETGVTVMLMNKKLDAGPILVKEKLAIDRNETSASLSKKLADLGARVLPAAVAGFVSGKIKPQIQDETKASFARALKKSDGHIDWDEPAEKVERLIRAMHPWPGAFSFLEKNQNKMLKIISANYALIEDYKHRPGQIFMHNNQLAVKCSCKALLIDKLQLEGKNKMAGKEFINGYKNYINRVLS